MKTLLSTTIISIYIFFLASPLNGFSQEQPQKTDWIGDTSKDIGQAFSDMFDNAVLVSSGNSKTCSAKSLIDIVDKQNLDVTYRLTSTVLRIAHPMLPPNDYSIIGDYDKGEFKTFQDKMLNAMSNSKSFIEFIKNATGLGIGEITAKRNEPTRGNKERKDIDTFREYYTAFKSYTGSWMDIDSENKAEYGANSPFNIDLSPTKHVGKKDGCAFYSKSKMRLQKLNYPKATWELSTEVFVECDCKDGDDGSKVKAGVYEYSSIVEGIFTYTEVSFGQSKKSVITIKSLECCPEKEEKEEPTKTALNDDDGIEDLMQNQTIGFGAGLGLTQDFEEITWCVTAEYLYQINTDEYKGWYVGGEATYQNTSFDDFSSNRTVVGAKVQHNFSAVPSGETQFVAGLMGNYAFGSNDNNGFKDDFTGTIFCAYGGVNIRICENWSIGAQFPILIFENFTFEPESGGEFKTDATSLFINKDNPLKIVIRRSL